MPRTTRTARAGSRSRWTPCWRGTCRSARSASCSGTTRCGSTAASRRRRASPLRLVPDRAAPRPSARLRSLLARNDRVLAVLGTPNAFHAQIMEATGCEAAFLGTGITGGDYTASADTRLVPAAARARRLGAVRVAAFGRRSPAGARRGVRHALRDAGQAPEAVDPVRALRPRPARGLVYVPARPGAEGDELGISARLQGAGHRRLDRFPGQARRQPVPPNSTLESVGLS